MADLSGKVALVSGAAGGIGQAICSSLLAWNAMVVAVDRQPVAVADGLADRLHPELGDITDEAWVLRLFKDLADRGLSPDIVVCNAGVYPPAPFADITLTDWRHVFAVNVEGAFLLCQAALPNMRRRGWGRVIGIGSNTQQLGWPMLSHYVASKCALSGLMRTLAIEYGSDGVTANVVCATLTRTPGTAALFEHAPEMVETVVSRQAIQRAGRPEDVSGVVALLCTDEAAFVTGQTIAADGGLMKL